MSVVDCHVAKIRPQYKNLQEWMADEKNVYIGRAGVGFSDYSQKAGRVRFPQRESVFANRFKIGKDGTREEVIRKYEEDIIKKLEEDVLLRRELVMLKGKNLGCWCHPEPCHGDVLLRLIDKYAPN